MYRKAVALAARGEVRVCFVVFHLKTHVGVLWDMGGILRIPVSLWTCIGHVCRAVIP